MTTTLPPELTPGTWAIDPEHSEAAFTAKHAKVTKVRGTVRIKDGFIVVGPDLESSSVRASLDPTSVETGNGQRDDHLRSKDFFGIEEFPEWTFASTAVRPGADAENFVVTGELTIHGVTNSVDLAVEFGGVGDNATGDKISGFSATTKINREDFDLKWDGKTGIGNSLVSRDISIDLQITAVAQV
jgi:polyisoprenoid-binding protein YceI